MVLIKNNPYRIIGMLVGTSTREEHTKKNKLKMYIAAEQEVPEDYSFPVLGDLNRTIENIELAVAQLTLGNDRVNASLFWFYNGNIITDEPVFNTLKDSTQDDKLVIDVWTKLTASGEVTIKNASAFQNLSTFYLNSAFKKKSVLKNKLEKGIILKLKFLESEFLNDFIKRSTDETYKVTKETLEIQFLTLLYQEIENTDASLIDWYMDCITKISFIAKKKYLGDFVVKPIEQIKQRISDTKLNRKQNPSKSYDLGLKLYENESHKVNTILNILGSDNIQYSSISDKLSDEILQCGIDYFNKYKDTKTDPSAKAMDLFKKAKKLAVGSIAIQRCQENTEGIQDWIDDKPERDKLSLIKPYLDNLLSLFDEFESKNETIANAKLLVNKAKPILNNLKSALGSTDELYLKLSTRVAGQAQRYIIEEVNNVQDNIDYKLSIDRYGTLSKIKSALSNGWEVTNLIGTLDMDFEFKMNRYNPNKNTLKSLCNQLDVSTTISAPRLTPTPRPTATPSPAPTSDTDDINWVAWIIGIILFIFVIKSCNAATKNDYDNTLNYDTSIDTNVVIIDTAVAIANTTNKHSIQNAGIIDSTAISYEETQSNLKLEDIDGKWYGTSQQFDDDSTWNITLNINSYNDVYEIEYPDLGCKGNLLLINSELGNIVFKEKIYTGLNNCVNNLRAELFIINSNKIKINYYYNGSNELNATAYLTK